jgi:hypothetical protein
MVDEPSWVAEMFNRMARMESHLLADTEMDAVAQLDTWASTTAAALQIDRSA